MMRPEKKSSEEEAFYLRTIIWSKGEKAKKRAWAHLPIFV